MFTAENTPGYTTEQLAQLNKDLAKKMEYLTERLSDLVKDEFDNEMSQRHAEDF